MEHEQIAEQNVVQRYLMGSLTPDEEELFEEHLLECAECRRQVQWEEDFQNSLHAVAAEEAARATTVVRVGLLAWLARHRRGWLLSAAVLLLAALPVAWLLREQGRLHDQITRLEAAAQSPVQPVPISTPTVPGPERQAVEAELRTERDARTRLAEQIARLTQPQVNTPIFSLGLVRGAEQAPTRIDLGSDPEWIVLAVELPAEEAPSYRAILTADGRTVWKGEGLKAGADGTVAITVYSTLLGPGTYRLKLEAMDAQGHGSPAGEIPFRVTR